MNYNHAYHAGNFCDVIKHIILTDLIARLLKKPKPLCYIDTHAGAGLYDLSSLQTSKTKEYVLGIEKIIQADNPPPLVKHYLDYVHKINNDYSHASYAALRYYPGSPLLARYLLPSDNLVLACDLNTSVYQELKTTLASHHNTAVHHADGLLALKAFLPPKERRGLVLIDPPYEDADEFKRLAKTLPLMIKKFETGVYAIWYPIKDRASVDSFHKTLKVSIDKPMLSTEVTIFPDLPGHLNGSGVTIINPPYQFEASLQTYLPWVWQALSQNKQGGYKVSRL